MKLQEKLNKKRVFITGSRKKLNISFVPALASYKYEEYAQKSATLEPKLKAEQIKLLNPEYKKGVLSNPEQLTEFNETARKLREEAQEVNDLGLEIITIVLEENDQDFDVCEKNIFRRMSLDDMQRFIMEACLPNFGENEKKK